MSDQHIILLIDNSHSMKNFFSKMAEGINALTYRLKKEAPAARVTLIKFCDTSTTIWLNTPPHHLCLISAHAFEPPGGTALYDAVGDVLNQFHPEDSTHNTLYIVTDGEDNFSKRYTRENIVTLTDAASRTGHWTINFCDTVSRTFDFTANNHILYKHEDIDQLLAGLSL